MVVLARVDQRLIHGLIVNQWAPHLQVKRFMVVDDVLCNNEEIKASMSALLHQGISKLVVGVIFRKAGGFGKVCSTIVGIKIQKKSTWF